MSQPGELVSGTSFGAYEIVRRVGAGGMGAVYEATHSRLGKRVAIKTLHREVVQDVEALARFIREGQTAARIHHPHVIDVSDVGTYNGTPYLVMEFLDGENLASLLAREGPLTCARTAELLLPVCAAVAAAHDERVVHRDLKPDNIVLSLPKDGGIHPKVVDFGISKVKSLDAQAASLTPTDTILGTPYYMSPEQARGAKQVDARADQFALGVILYECVAGRRPFVGETAMGVLYEITRGAITPPREIRSEISSEFEAVVLRAMKIDPGERFANVRELGAALARCAPDTARIRWESAFARVSIQLEGPALCAHREGGSRASETEPAIAAPMTLRASTSAIPTPAVAKGTGWGRTAVAGTALVVALAGLASMAGGDASSRVASRPGRDLGAVARVVQTASQMDLSSPTPPVAVMAPHPIVVEPARVGLLPPENRPSRMAAANPTVATRAHRNARLRPALTAVPNAASDPPRVATRPTTSGNGFPIVGE